MTRNVTILTIVMLLLAASPRQSSGQSPVPEGAEVERIAEGFRFLEGPVWFDGALLFSDIPANTIYRWTPDEGVVPFLTPSGNSNGLAVDRDGVLLVAQHGDRQIGRLQDGRVTAVASEYDGHRLNSPNDLYVHPDGSIYFTDPPYGIQEDEAELDFAGVYRIDPDGQLHVLEREIPRPNGIVMSPDGRTLYVSTSDQRTVVAYDLDDHTLSNRRVLAEFDGGGATDGMKVDPAGRLYVTAPGGVHILSPDGSVVDVVEVPEATTNLAWAGDGRTLFITAGTSLYRIELAP